MLKGKDGMKLMIASFSGAIPIEPKHISFWKNVLNLVYGKLRYNIKTCVHVQAVCAWVRVCMRAWVRVCITYIMTLLYCCSARNSIIVKEQVQKVIAEIRGFKPLRLSLNQLGALARHFKKRVRCIS